MRSNFPLLGLIGAMAAVVLLPAHARPLAFVSQETNRNDTIFSLGIQWDFGDSVPQAMVAVRHTQTQTDDSVFGAKLDLAIPLNVKDHFQPTFRALGLAGTRDLQGEAGVGFKIGPNDMIFGGGVQAPFVNGGVNYIMNKTIAPYFGMNMLGRAPSPTSKIILIRLPVC